MQKAQADHPIASTCATQASHALTASVRCIQSGKLDTVMFPECSQWIMAIEAGRVIEALSRIALRIQPKP